LPAGAINSRIFYKAAEGSSENTCAVAVWLSAGGPWVRSSSLVFSSLLADIFISGDERNPVMLVSLRSLYFSFGSPNDNVSSAKPEGTFEGPY
jgi:hypothetical protein